MILMTTELSGLVVVLILLALVLAFGASYLPGRRPLKIKAVKSLARLKLKPR